MQSSSTLQLYAYACGTKSTFGSSYNLGFNLCEPLAPSLSLRQAINPLSELADMALDITLMMHDHIIKSMRSGPSLILT